MCAFAFGARTGVRITLIASLRKTASKPWLNLESRSWISSCGPLAAILETHQQVARLLHLPNAIRIARAGHVLDPAAANALKTRTYNRRSHTVSTVRKSQASVGEACWRRNERQSSRSRRAPA
jgi:hypothetical protein